jgi:hypothetical protein
MPGLLGGWTTSCGDSGGGVGVLVALRVREGIRIVGSLKVEVPDVEATGGRIVDVEATGRGIVEVEAEGREEDRVIKLAGGVGKLKLGTPLPGFPVPHSWLAPLCFLVGLSLDLPPEVPPVV